MNSTPTIDRRALVQRHNVTQTSLDPRSPVSVGNGEFAFTVDLTGLQSLPGEYPVHRRPHEPDRDLPGTLLGTMSQWGWHSIPGEREYSMDETTRLYEVAGRRVPYVDEQKPPSPGADATKWFRANPHRLNLARIGFVAGEGKGVRALRTDDVRHAAQTLDLWSGIVSSDFLHRGVPVHVTTAVHPDRDRIGAAISGASQAGLQIAIDFPYGSGDWHNAEDWSAPKAHRTALAVLADGWIVDRELDGSRYRAHIRARGLEVSLHGPHRLLLTPVAPEVDLAVEFTTDGSGDMVLLPNRAGHAADALRAGDAADVIRAAAEHWPGFWRSGSALQIESATDPRAVELERRVVLSQFVTAVNCAGSLPPQETGLVCNSWRGKFHLEMHWWHAAHFPQWGRPGLLQRSLSWYTQALAMARENADAQGYAGARWPKQLGSAFRETPSSIGVFLIWQQPHPIHLAELVYRATADDSVLEQYAEVVFETADFMADYAHDTGDGFALGPPLVPAQESYGGERARMSNPTFELAYWRWGLRVANSWRARMGLEPQEHWSAVAEGIVPPHIRDGVYTAVDVEPFTIRRDHPSMLGAWGILPDVGLIDPDIMRATYEDVRRDWEWTSTWGWDYPMMAMTASRLGEPEWAADALLNPAGKNVVLPNGHNHQTESLPLYLPGNGGVLAAVALMARQHIATGRGFPAGWHVDIEGFTVDVE